MGLPKGIEHWSLTTRRKKVIKIEAMAIGHARYIVLLMAEVAIP